MTATPPHAPRWTTPRVLSALLGLAWLASALVLAVGLRALDADRAALRVLRTEAAPTIVVAQQLGAELAGLDAQLAVSMLAAGPARHAAQEQFEAGRAAVARRLVDAASYVTLGDAERTPVVVMTEELGRYLELAARAQALYASGDRDGALGLVRQATDHMHERILPRALDLDRIKRDHLDLRYEAAQARSQGFEVEAIAAGALLLVVLLGAQVFVRVRMRRRVVPALLVAAIVAAAFTSYLVGRFRVAREDRRVARDDAFNSLHLLWRARAVAEDARGDDVRWLLDRPRAAFYQSAYSVKIAQLSSEPATTKPADDAGGLLPDEVRNVTFDGERDAAQAAVDALADVTHADDAVRRLERSGNHEGAVDHALALRSDGARAAFERLDAALQATIAINQSAFDAVLGRADSGLRRAEWVDPAVALVLALFAWLGIRPRVREYAG